MQKILMLILLFVVSGCVNDQTNDKLKKQVAAYPEPKSPFGLSFNRQLHYQADDKIDTSLFSLKEVFLSDTGERKFNKSTKLGSSPVVNNLIKRGFSLLGTPYRYGGQSTRTGFDCSGFVSYLFKEQAGVELPRSTQAMIRVNAPVVKPSNLKPGDVLFFATGRGKRVSHTGIYVGNHYFIHSSNHRTGVRLDSLNDRYWKLNFLEAKRVLN